MDQANAVAASMIHVQQQEGIMGRKGRPRRNGPRTKKDTRPSRAGEVTPFDYGNDRTKAAHTLYGEHYSSALGRAYAAGLLGEDNLAKDRLDGAKRFMRLSKVIAGVGGGYRCPLDDTPRGGTNHHAPKVSDRDHAWFYAAARSMDAAGLRETFNELITNEHHDQGPEWLDRLLIGVARQKWNMRHHALNVDRIMLEAAIRALDIVAPPPRVQRILVETWA